MGFDLGMFLLNCILHFTLLYLCLAEDRPLFEKYGSNLYTHANLFWASANFTRDFDVTVGSQYPIVLGIRKLNGNLSYDNEIISSRAKICIMDKISIDWTLSQDEGTFTPSLDDVSLAVIDGNGSKMFLTPLGTSTSISEQPFAQANSDRFNASDAFHSMLEEPLNSGLIQCAIDGDHCSPSVRSIVSYAERGRLSIIFDHPTNTPLLDSSYAIRSALNIIPRLFGGAIGEWTSADTLGKTFY